MNRLCVFAAQGFGAGKIRFAPGTFGSIVGIAWFFLLILSQSLSFFIVGTVAGLMVSIWCCGVAERELGQRDPGSVVLDEITAMPVCFTGWLMWYWSVYQTLPDPGYFTRPASLPMHLITFGAFRLFDIWKPWPIRQSQNLSGGLGITLDDVLAGTYAALVAGATACVMGPRPM